MDDLSRSQRAGNHFRGGFAGLDGSHQEFANWLPPADDIQLREFDNPLFRSPLNDDKAPVIEGFLDGAGELPADAPGGDVGKKSGFFVGELLDLLLLQVGLGDGGFRIGDGLLKFQNALFILHQVFLDLLDFRNQGEEFFGFGKFRIAAFQLIFQLSQLDHVVLLGGFQP